MQGDHQLRLGRGARSGCRGRRVLPSGAAPYGFLYNQYETLDIGRSLGFFR